MVGISRVGVMGRVQEVALVLLGGSWLVEQQLGVCWVLTPTSTITAWPHPHLLLGGSLVGGVQDTNTEVRHIPESRGSNSPALLQKPDVTQHASTDLNLL